MALHGWIGLAVLLAGNPAGPNRAAQAVTVTLRRTVVATGAELVATVRVPDGARVARPRFHALRDREPLPNARSRGWVDFPALAGTQEVALRAPDEEGRWWLILNDGATLVARVPFEVVDWLTALRLERDRLERELGLRGSGAPPSPNTPGAPPGVVSIPPDQPLLPGRLVDVTIALPAGSDPNAALVLRWVGLAERVPATVPGTGLMRLAQVYLPPKPGRYELELVAGEVRIAVVTVVVQDSRGPAPGVRSLFQPPAGGFFDEVPR